MRETGLEFAGSPKYSDTRLLKIDSQAFDLVSSNGDITTLFRVSRRLLKQQTTETGMGCDIAILCSSRRLYDRT